MGVNGPEVETQYYSLVGVWRQLSRSRYIHINYKIYTIYVLYSKLQLIPKESMVSRIIHVGLIFFIYSSKPAGVILEISQYFY